jgi:RHS repeat-associated protein
MTTHFSEATTKTMNRRRTHRPLLSAALALLAIPAGLALWAQAPPDTDPPQIQILESGTALTDGRLFNRAATPVVQVTDASAVTVDAQLDGAAFTSGAQVAGEGGHQLAVTATDAAGNTAAVTVGFEIDTTPPAFAAVLPASDSVTGDPQVTLQGEVSGATAVTVDGQPATLVGQSFTAGPYTLTQQGVRSWTIAAADAAGNTAQRTHRLAFDSQAPAVAISQPAAGSVVKDGAVDVVGSAQDPRLAGVTVNGVAANVNGSTWLAPHVPLAEGSNTLTARAEDRAGNAAEASRAVVRDSQPPVLAVTDPAPGTVVPGATITLRGTASDPHLDRVEVNGSRAQLSGGVWSLAVTLREGNNDFALQAFDSVGNVSTVAVSVARDSQAPAVAITQPADGARLSAQTVTVNGTVAQKPGIAVTVNGSAAAVTGGAFTLAGVPLVEGDNTLIARARDSLGNEGTYTRKVVRDTAAPALLASDPAAGALALPVDAVFRLTFSEAMATPAAGSWRLETGAGQAIAATATLAGDLLTVRPGAPLPSSAQVRLVLTASLTDPAGNPLASPPALAFFTADINAPGTPVLSPEPAHAVCAPSLTLAGTAEAGAIVRVQGGAAAAEARTGETGHFSVDVQLVPESINLLRLNAVDAGGNISDALLAQVIADCQPPRVLSADRQGDQFRIVFSERVTSASVAQAIHLSSPQGAVAGSPSLGTDGKTATFTPSGSLPAGALRLEVSVDVRDLAGNVMAFPWSQVFGAQGGDGFVSGTVIDDAAGRPLAGAQVLVFATNGIELPDPKPAQVTGPDGRFRLPVPAGTHDLTIVRPGYTSAFRVVTTAAGQGIDVFDPRLTPAVAAQTIGGAGGAAGTGAAPVLTLPAGALAGSTAVAATLLSEQGSPAPFPYGWSPRGAAWLDLSGAALLAPSTLSLPVESPDGTTLTLVRLDLATLQWRVLGTDQVAGGRVAIPLAAAAAGLTDGGYAAIEGDDGPTAPPAAVAGTVLGGSPRPFGGDVTSAALTFTPEVVLPSQTSLATAAYTTAQEVASGLLLTLVIQENLTLLDESSRRQAPYEADLILYHAPGGAARSRFRLRPSETARTLPIKMGAEDVTLRTYGEAVEGNVVGADGGTVSDAEGDRADLPAGAVADPTAVTLTRKTAQDLPLALPAGTELAGVVSLDLGGRGLLAPAALSLALSPAPSSGGKGLLLQVVSLETGPAWRPVAALLATASGWSTAAIDPADLPWPGVRDEGLYAFVRLTASFGYLRGTVHDVGGAALAGARVRGASLSWLQIAGAGGRYVLPAPVGAVDVTAENPGTGDQGAASGAIPAADARVDLDITLASTGPRVVEITPANGAVDAPQGIQPTVRFSEAVDPASVTAALQLLQGGERVAIDVDLQGSALARVTPRATLLPGTAYELRVGTGVRDLQDNPLEAPAAVLFTTRRILESHDLDLSRVFLVEPDANGDAHVIGRAGAVPARTLVFVENRSALANTPSVDAGTDGSFSLELHAALTHRLVLHALIAGGNEVVVELTPFHTADLKGAYVGSQALTFTTGDGVTVRVPEGTFAGPTRVRVEPQPLSPPASPVPSGMAAVYNFKLDFSGAEAKKALQISIPKPAGAPDAVEGVYLLNRMIVIQGKTYWMMHDLMRLDATAGRLTTELPPAGTAAVVAALGDPFRLAAAQAPGGPALAPKAIVRTYKNYVTGSAFPGQYQVAAARIPLGFTIFPSFDMNFLVGIWNLGMEGMATAIDRSVSQLLEGDGILIPTRRHEPFTLVVRDLSTGFRLSQQTFPPVEGDELVELPPDVYGDKDPPMPVNGNPVRFIPVNLAGPAEQELAPGIKARLEGNSITVTGEDDSTQKNVQIRLIGLDDTADATATSNGLGSFDLGASGRAGNRYLLAIGARIPADRPLDLTFSEALFEGFPGIDVLDAGGRTLHPEKDPVGTRATARVRLKTGWRAGQHYTLHLGRELADASGNAWQHDLNVEFEVAASDNIGTFELPAVRDVAHLGSWLFVAADTKGMMVLNADDPAHLTNVLPGDRAMPFPFSDAVRGVAVDPHGRVLVAGGGVTSPGQLKIFDPLVLDVEGITAHPDDLDLLLAAYKGSTIISDKLGGTGTQLPSGLPRRVAVLSNDDTDEWELGKPVPAGITVTEGTPSSGPDGSPLPDFTVTVTGTGAQPGMPVSLQDVDLGRWNRVDAGTDGHYSITLEVQKGDQLRLLRNRDSIAYVATSGVGLEVVDVNAFYNEDHGFVQSDIRGTYSGYRAGLTLCGQPVADIGTAFTDLDTLFDPDNLNPLTVVGLVSQRGFILLRSNPDSVGDISLINTECAEVDGSTAVSALAVLQHYAFDLDGDGELEPSEDRDYVLVAHQVGGVLIYDVTDRENIQLVGRIRMPGQVFQLSVDRDGRRLIVAGAGAGFYVVDLDVPPSRDLLDEDQDGKDDRILETVTLTGNTNANVHLIPELGLALAGGVSRGLTTVALGHPRVDAITRDEDGKYRKVGRLAPFGVATAKENESDADSPSLPGSFRVRASLPGLVGDSVTLKVSDLAASSCLIDELPTEKEVTLHRMAAKAFEPGHQMYLSDEIAVVSDPRASRKYDRTEDENQNCVRCDQDDENVSEGAVEVLSGDFVGVTFPDELREQLKDVYSHDRLDASELHLQSVRWDTVPADHQEAPHHAGFADEAPGLLGNSGEMSSESTDLAIRGRGLDFVLHRTYRSQTIGAGPFGPGWDFNYNERIRVLPNGDVDYYDGSGRRETFKKQQDGTLKAPTGMFVTLERVSSGWVMIDAHHMTTRFDDLGRLTSIADSVKDSKDTGNEITFFYDAKSRLVRAHDTTDRDILFERREQGCGEISKIIDFDNREFLYEYDDKNRLVSVKTPAVETVLSIGNQLSTQLEPLETRYTYDSASGSLAQVLGQRDNLTSVSDPKRQDWLKVNYGDAHGNQRKNDVTSQTWGGGNIQIDYQFNEHKSTVTDPRGNTFSYTYNDKGQVQEVKDPANGTVHYTHDAEGLVTSRTDAYNRLTTYEYDSSGDRRSRGNLTSVTVTPDGRGTNGSAALLVTSTEYEGYSNQPVQIIDPRGTKTVISRNEVGLPTAVTQAANSAEASTTQTSYNEHGQPTQVINPNHHITQYQYNQNGYPSGMVADPAGLGLVTHFNCDQRGNMTSITDPRGVTFTRSYNALNWLTQTRRAVTSPRDNPSAPAPGYAATYFYDPNGNVVEERLPYGDGSTFTRRAYIYGPVDELTFTLEQAAPSQPLSDWSTTGRTYDLNRNLILLVEPNGQTTAFAYDQRNYLASTLRGVSAEHPEQQVTEHFAFDLEGQRTSYTDGRGGIWTTAYDGYGRVSKTVDAVGNSATVSYDDVSNPTTTGVYQAPEQTGGDAVLLAQKSAEYDRLNRPKAIAQKLWLGDAGAGRDLTSSFEYDAASNLVKILDPMQRPTTSEFDHAERLVATVDAVGNRTVLDLDPTGNPVSTTATEVLPAGGSATVTTTSTYDALGRLATAQDALGNVQKLFYDARDNLRLSIDPEQFVTERSYDGLDRLTREVKPEGISVDYDYDKSSRLTSYKDALDQETTYSYDALNRRKGLQYPDHTQELYEYDASGNPKRITDANGNVITQTFDPANRLTSRSVGLGNGVIGPTGESYVYDGLNRMTQATSGNIATLLTFDSLSRLVHERNAGRDVDYQLDDVGNPTRIQYPSGFALGQSFDTLDRPRAIDWASNTASPFAHPVSYTYRGTGLVVSKTLGNGLAGTRQYDAVRRLLDETFQTATGQAVFRESLAWTPRSLKAAQTRRDLNGEGMLFAYDGAGRLTQASKKLNPSLANNSVAAPGDFAQLTNAFAYTYDKAQNLLSTTKKENGVPEAVALPLDGSKRNRPASVGAEALAWDANGNLLRKGDQRFQYDYRNRLTRVSRANGDEVAVYQYDAFNRRIRKTVDTEIYETAWRGWQPVEEYHNGTQPDQRRVYGLGLDEIVQFQTDFNSSGQPGQIYAPVYDSTGNLAVMTGNAGKPIERYEYTPYGERKIFVDTIPPAVEQVRVKGNALWVEISEGVSPDALAQAGTELKLINLANQQEIGVTVAQPVATGREANRRLVISLTGSAPAPQTQVRLTLPAAALQDLFLNQPAQDFEFTFAWPESDAVVQDNKAIELKRATVHDGYLEIELSEEPDPATTTAILVDGAASTWTLGDDRYTLKSATLLPPGSHTLAIGTTLADLNGGTLAQAFTTSLSVLDKDNKSLFEAVDPRQTQASTIGNLFGFQGLPVDPETGLVYFRNRYYDPEMGRFISVDPKGYIDGPSMYAFEMDDPTNGRDPMGFADTDTRDVLNALWIMVGGDDAADDFKTSGQGFSASNKKYDAVVNRSNPPVSPEDAKDNEEYYRSAAANNQGLIAPIGPITRDVGKGIKYGGKGIVKSAQVVQNVQLAGGVFGLAKKLGIERAEGESVLMFSQRVEKEAAKLEAAGGAEASSAVAPKRGTDFVAGENGVTVPVSQKRTAAGFDAAGFPAKPTDSAGMEYTLPDGKSVRLMEPTKNAPRRASFEDGKSGPINPFTGKPPQPPKKWPNGTPLTAAERKKWVRDRTHVEQTP